MVEEIHELETKCVPGGSQDNANASEKHHIHDSSSLRETHQPPPNPTDDQGFGLSRDPRDKPWGSGIRSRLECDQVPMSVEGSLINFERYPQSGSEFGSLGAVSLSLGLMHNVGVRKQQLQLHFGEEMMCESVD